MGRLTYILTLILGLSNLTNGQTLPDSLQDTWVARLTDKDTLTIFLSDRSDLGNNFEKFQLTKNNDQYILTTFRLTDELSLKLENETIDSVLPDKLDFKKTYTYELTDISVIRFAQFEMLGEKFGIQPIEKGYYGTYKLVLKDKTKLFSSANQDLLTLYYTAIPLKYNEDRNKNGW